MLSTSCIAVRMAHFGRSFGLKHANSMVRIGYSILFAVCCCPIVCGRGLVLEYCTQYLNVDYAAQVFADNISISASTHAQDPTQYGAVEHFMILCQYRVLHTDIDDENHDIVMFKIS